MKKSFYSFLLALLPGALATLSPGTLPAQSPTPKTFDTTGIADLKKAVEAHPRDLNAHQDYIKAMDIANPGLEPQYEKWMKQFPGIATIPFALGHTYCNHESPRAKPWLLKATAINDTMSAAWSDLSFDASRWGSEEASRTYMGKAAAAAPSDPNYSFYYAMDFEFTDPAKWHTMIYDLAKRFPDNERGAQGLYWMAFRSTDTAEKIRVFEQLKTAYPPSKFNWSSSGMQGLFDVYLSLSPEKALALAKEMGKDGGWPEKTTLADNIVKARAYLASHDLKAADALLGQIKAPRYSDALELIALLKARLMDAMDKTAPAYDSLSLLSAKSPSDELYQALHQYGTKLGKNTAQVNADVLTIRDAGKKPAPPFNLGLYTSDGKASLSDYKGKVVLLTFWFPGCGPCRGEFPHFETVMDKFKGKDVAYIGINVFPEQDAYVVPFMKGTHYSFTPLRGTSEWASQTYKVRGEPTNFIIDPDGNIVFTNFRASDPHTERMLELMISSLLPQKEPR